MRVKELQLKNINNSYRRHNCSDYTHSDKGDEGDDSSYYKKV